MKENTAKAETESATTRTPGTRPPVHDPILVLQRQAGNRAVSSIVAARAGVATLPSPSTDGPVSGHAGRAVSTTRPPTLQRAPQLAAGQPTAGNWEAVFQRLSTMDMEAVSAELRKYSHEDLIKFATYFYSTPRPPGGPGSAVLREAFHQIDPEAMRIGQLNADYASAYREQRWPDIIRLLNGYNDDDIVAKVATWNQFELHEGVFQAQQMFGVAASVRLTGPMLNRIPPPAVGPGTGPQLIAAGPDAAKTALAALQLATPCRVNGGAMGDVQLQPGAYANGKLLVSATPTGVYYTQGASLFQMWAPDFVRDLWLNGISEGASRAEGMVRLAKLEFEILAALFVPWWGMLGLGLLEALETADANRPQITKLKAAIPQFSAQRAEFKRRYPTLYDKFFWHCLGEVIQHIPEGVQIEDVAYLLGRIAGTQGLMGAFGKALATGTVVTAKTIAKIVAEYLVLVTILHAPAIIGRAAKAAAQDAEAMAKAAAETRTGLADVGIEVTTDEATAIAQELVAGGDPRELLYGLQHSTQDMADAIEVLQRYWETHAI